MGFFSNLFKRKPSLFQHLGGAAFKQKFQSTKNAVLLDVRTSGEFRSGAIKGAQNVDFLSGQFASKVSGLDKNKVYFLYCRSGNRSGKACHTMAEMGFEVYNLEGGIGAWPQ